MRLFRTAALAVTLLLIPFAAMSYVRMVRDVAEYQRLNAQDKLDTLWNEIINTEYVDALPTDGPSNAQILGGLGARFLQTTFLHSSDFMPVGRRKLIHPFGSVARVRLVIDRPGPATGVLSTGGIGLVRMSLAAPSGAFTPGMALKILINGEPSVNLIAMFSLDGQGDDQRFFANPFSSVVDEPRSGILKLGAAAFRNSLRTLPDAPENERTLPLDEAASILPDGSRVENPEVPYAITFTPTREAMQVVDRRTDRDYRIRLEDLREGTVLYRLHLRDRAGGISLPIGSLILDSRFVASSFGDDVLFFEHPQARFR